MAQEEETQHALLIPWGHFAREMDLISGIEAVKLNQKVYEHTPQGKLIEFFPKDIGTMWWRSCRERSICRTSAWQRTR